MREDTPPAERGIRDVDGDDAVVVHGARKVVLVTGYHAAARRALAFARLYRAEEGVAGGERERACIAQARAWRRAVRDLRDGQAIAPSARPGLARAAAEDIANEAALDSNAGRKTG